MRIAWVTNILTPYRIPVYRALAATPGWKLRIFVSAGSEFDRSWKLEPSGLDVESVAGFSFRGRNRTRGRIAIAQVVTRHVPTGLFRSLARFAPDLVVSSELGPRTALALLYARLARVPLVIWSYHSRVSARGAGAARRAWWRLLLARADAVIGMGVQAREVLGRLGVPRERIFDAPNAHDHASFRTALSRVDVQARHAALEDELDVRKNVALVAGRLISAKGISPLLAAWNRIPEELRADWTLLFVGSGPLSGRVQAEGAGRRPGEVVWLPAVQPDELAGLYAVARLVVFPTLSEPWGLVVNEAFACGRPVVCSVHAGCADDLVRPGENGWLADPTDPADFARVLAEALTSPDLDRMGEAARATAERLHPDAMADGLRRAVEMALT